MIILLFKLVFIIYLTAFIITAVFIDTVYKNSKVTTIMSVLWPITAILISLWQVSYYPYKLLANMQNYRLRIRVRV
jgi:uncharacterized membrane protein YqjE